MSLSLTSALVWPLTFLRIRLLSVLNPSETTPRQRPAQVLWWAPAMAPTQNSGNPKAAADLVIPREVFTFRADLGEQVLCGALPTG